MKNEFDYLNDVKVDFTTYELTELTESEREKMKSIIEKSNNIKIWRLTSIAACFAVIAIFSQTVFAQNIIDNIIKNISTGFNHFIQIDSSNIELELPKELQGKLFDKDGKPLAKYKSGDTAYTADGEFVMDISKYAADNFKVGICTVDENGMSIKISNKNDGDPLAADDESLVINEENELQSYLDFTAKRPAYLPDNIKFYGAKLFKNEDGTVSGDYLVLYYKNEITGKLVYVHERIINNETSFTSSSDGTIEEVKVKGNKAVLMDGTNLSWEADNVSIYVIGKDTLTKKELFKVAESF